MKRRNKISVEPKYILLVCSILCVILIFVSFRYREKLLPLKSAVGSVITPMQKGINTVGSFLSDQIKQLENINALLQEKDALQKKVDQLSYENKLLLQERYELENLRKLYELDEKYASYPKVAARVISGDPGNWYNTFKIDKGSEDGIAVDMNVMAGAGLVGIITEVGHNYSIVRSIIDDSSYVSGMFLKTSDTCDVKGDLQLFEDGHIRVERISKNAQIEDGYEVVTSHISPKYLQGILIGYISNITVDSSNLTKTGYLTPAVDFSKLEVVLIITELKEKLY